MHFTMVKGDEVNKHYVKIKVQVVILSISIQQAFLCNIIVFQDYWRLSLISNCEGVAVVQVVTFSTIKAHFLLGTVGINSWGSSTMHTNDDNNTCTWLAQASILA